ncbi:hypothetical protein KUTeg_020557 [Tegillarca granosa]|uniref:MACPF domain-containing protein n=1 Tax=Tegillarca granosa TaxID=220873 RepID=A0ABQ9EDJ3_TEGGR|nr:hypothetical protein KUTeg_020557 [Tegillarca granosa]
MKLRILLFLSICSVLSVNSEEKAPHQKDITAPKGSARYCFQLNKNKNLIRYEVLPGGGWDNLRNKEAGQVVSYNFSHCRTTDDGRYLIPDNTYTIPLKSSLLETFAELFDHWQNYKATTSTSINVEAGLHLTHFGIDGKFSSESEKVKKQMIQDQSITTRVQARYIRYTAKLQPDSELNPSFRKRILSIAAHLQLNRTNMARYESQLLVRDFGTHVITSIDAGAAIVQQDQIKSKFTESYSFVKNQILAAASASFFSVASISTEYKLTTTQEMIDQYLQNRTHSHINSYGGPVFKPQNFTLNKWGEQIDNELVAMDRSGDPIYFLITPFSLPELPPSVVYKLIQSVKTAVKLYYKFNIYRGCTKVDSPNFSFQANIDDGTCKSKETNFTFGGVYQACWQSGSLSDNICNGLVQKNPLTGDTSCPKEYEAVLVNSWTSSKSESHHECHRCWLFAHCCHDSTYYGSAQISSYWCVARDHVDQQHGFLFGGVFTSTVGNIVTQTRSCPQFFYPLKMGRDLYVCVSDDYELGSKYSVPFAGFYSCVFWQSINASSARTIVI